MFGRAPRDAAKDSRRRTEISDMSATLDPNRLYSIDQIADRWRVSGKTVRRLIDRGDLRHVRIGGQKRLRPEDVLEYETRERK